MAELKIDDLKPVNSEEAQEPTPHQKAAEKLKQAARALHEAQGNIAPTSEQHDINVLRAELKDKVAELRDLKKTISKMQQTHEAELQDLKDQLGEMKAALAATDKSKAEINRERLELIDASENDDERFEEIEKLAQSLCLGARQLEHLAMIVKDKAEGR